MAAGMTLLEALESEQRALDAERLRIVGGLVSKIAAPHRRAVGVAQDRGDEQREAGAAARSYEIAYRALRAELALALGMSEYRAQQLMELASRVVHEYPAVLTALRGGAINARHAEVIADAGLIIGGGATPIAVERRRAYEEAVLRVATQETPNRLKPMARRLAEAWAETPIEVRHESARAERRVVVVDGEDGMADLIAHLPVSEAYAIYDRLTRFARSGKRGDRIIPVPGGAATGAGAGAGVGTETGAETETGAGADARTRDQYRADALVDLLLAADPFALNAGCPAEAIDARIQLIAPAELVEQARGEGPAELLGELAGHGAVSMTTIREHAARVVHFERISTTETGDVLSVDRYRPSEEMRRRLGARDGHCRFPGCRVPVHRCDLDHTVDAAKGGPTSTRNLANLCRGHHTLKHHSEWTVEQRPGGVLEWTSPTRRVHVDRPPGFHEAPLRRRSPSIGCPSGDGRAGPPQEGNPPRRASRVRFEPVPEPGRAPGPETEPEPETGF